MEKTRITQIDTDYFRNPKIEILNKFQIGKTKIRDNPWNPCLKIDPENRFES